MGSRETAVHASADAMSKDAGRVDARVPDDQSWDFLFEVMPCPSVLTERNGRIVRVNRYAGLLLGAEPWRLVDLPLLAFAHDPVTFAVLLKQVADEGASVESELVVCQAVDRRVLTTAIVAPAHGAGSLLLWFFVGAQPFWTTDDHVTAGDPLHQEMREVRSRLRLPPSPKAVLPFPSRLSATADSQDGD